jgi:NAD(P)-dependent dehydrogenase (short-subunit alcohol dehydrogenase family)
LNHPSFKGKNIWITGGSLGLGYAVAEELALSGARVLIASRTERDLRTAVGRLKEKSGGEHGYRLMDVGKKSEVEDSARWAQKTFGHIDGLVNCAGIYGPIGRLNEISMDEFAEAIQINFLGTVFMCHYFAPLMKNRNAKIVNFSGGGASTPFPNYSAYAASKTAVVRLTENLAEEFKPLGISVNAVAPGFVVTRLHEQTLKAGERAGKFFLEGTRKQIEKGGVPPEKAAHLTAFLLSEESEGVNGKFISAPWDQWEKPEFLENLKNQKNFATLRRIDQMNFTEIR